MKISNSKKQLAKIISDNGGWREGANWATQGRKRGGIGFCVRKPKRIGWQWKTDKPSLIDVIYPDILLPNWHQTILARDEYRHLYPAPDADGWIEWKGGKCPVELGATVDVRHRDGAEFNDTIAGRGYAERWTFNEGFTDIIAYRPHKPEVVAKPERIVIEPEPTIEQLTAEYRALKAAADRKQQEADAAKAEADAKLAELVAAGKALGLVLSVVAPEPAPVFQVGDTVRLLRKRSGAPVIGEVGVVVRVDSETDLVINFPSQSRYLVDDTDVELVAKGAANA